MMVRVTKRQDVTKQAGGCRVPLCLVACLFLPAVLTPQYSYAEVAKTLRQAAVMSSSMGKPVFAVYGTEWCPHCVKLMDRLKNDSSLEPYANSFVVIRVHQEDPDWAAFNQRYETDRDAVPRLYIVSPNGDAMVKLVGAPSGDGLPRMLEGALRKTGPMINEKALAKINADVQSMQSDSGMPFIEKAIRWQTIQTQLDSANQFSPELESLTEELQRFNGELELKQKLATSAIEEDANDFEALVSAGELGWLFQANLASQSAGETIIDSIRRGEGDRAVTKAALDLSEANFWAYAGDKRRKRKAIATLARFVKAPPNDAAKEIAMEHLQKVAPNDPAINPEKAVEPSDHDSGAKMRTWTSADGKFKRSAIIVQKNETHVQLEGDDGEKFTVPIARLSKTDQEFLASQSD